jgi:hypothetical protein
MKNRELIKKISENIINNTDIKYISHYQLENLEWIVYDEIENNIWESSIYEIDDIIFNVYEYVFSELEKEKIRFLKYWLPVYVNTLINKIWKK